jgi:hypothetical protein
MGLESGKHSEKEINEIRCKVVETGISKDRVDFLKPLLEHNGLEVHYEALKKKEEADPATYILGVTDITFNPVLAIYKLELLTPDGRKVSPAYWRQESEDTTIEYWEV